MTVWKVEEDHLVALIQEINRLGQSLLKFDEKEYSNYFSSRLAEIALSMLGVDGTSPKPSTGEPSDNTCSTDVGTEGFVVGPYSYLFNSRVFLNENLLRETLAGIRQNRESIYKIKTQETECESSTTWQIEERTIIDLIKEVHRLGRAMGRSDNKSYDTYFSTSLPEIILKMLGIPESYSGTTPEDLPELVKTRDDDNKTDADDKSEKKRAKHPAAYDGSYDYDIFNYTMSDETLKKFLDYKREHQDEYRQIRAEQAKLGDKLYEPDAYDAIFDEMIKLAKSEKF